MNNFKEGGFKRGGQGFGGRPKFGGSKFGGDKRGGGKFSGGSDRGGRSGERSELFTATCSECRKSCEVPFRPSGDKPVYCSACFGMKKSDGLSEGRGDGRTHDRGRDHFQSGRPEHATSLQGGRTTRYSTPQEQPNSDLGDVKRQLAMIETRLTRIFDLLKQVVPVLKVAEADTAEAKAESLPKKERKPKSVKTKTVAIKKVVKKIAKKISKK